MKITISLLLFFALLSGSCATRKKKTAFDYPATMSDEVRADFVKRWEKGKILYQINCSMCHDSLVHGRAVTPDFAQTKIENYSLRIANPKHQKSIPDTRVDPEQLEMIKTYLTFKKKNGLGISL